jgi:hypothetical protein
MHGYSMPTANMVGDSLDHDAAVLRDVERALGLLRGAQTETKDVAEHLANAERELRAAARALKLKQ